MNNYAVIGLGKYGIAVAGYIKEEGGRVTVIDKNPEKTKDLKKQFSTVITIDATDMIALKKTGVSYAAAIIVSVGKDIESCTQIIRNLKELQIPLIFIATVNQGDEETIIKAGASSIINPGKESAYDFVQHLMWPLYYNLDADTDNNHAKILFTKKPERNSAREI